MGQKIDPRGFRLAVTKDWSSRWFANSKNFASTLHEDIKIREYLTKKFGRRASIGRILIERPAKNIKVTLFTARPGVIIGKKQIKILINKTKNYVSIIPTQKQLQLPSQLQSLQSSPQLMNLVGELANDVLPDLQGKLDNIDQNDIFGSIRNSGIDFEGLISKISKKVTEKIENKQINEDEIKNQAMNLIGENTDFSNMLSSLSMFMK